MSLEVWTDTSFRSGIIGDLVDTIAAMPQVMGVVDTFPFDWEHPPRPRTEHGVAAHPFVYVYEVGEASNYDAMTNQVLCVLDVNVDATFEYSITDADKSLMARGRALLAYLRAALFADPNRGSQVLPDGSTAKRAQRTIEGPAEIGEAFKVGGGLGVVTLKLAVEYARSATNPGDR